MKSTLRKSAAILFLLTLLLTPALPVYAQFNSVDEACASIPEDAEETPTLCEDNETEQNVEGNSIYGQNGILTRGARVFSILVGIASVIVIIIGGFRYVMSGGESTSVQGAKNTIIYAAVGLVVAALSQIIIAFVLTRIG